MLGYQLKNISVLQIVAMQIIGVFSTRYFVILRTICISECLFNVFTLCLASGSTLDDITAHNREPSIRSTITISAYDN